MMMIRLSFSRFVCIWGKGKNLHQFLECGEQEREEEEEVEGEELRAAAAVGIGEVGI
jgi:hypothetical protein